MSDSGFVSPRLARSRWVSLSALATYLIVALTLALNLAQQPGKITFDTKLDLQFDPADFLARSLSLWNGDWALGGLQNQASGYLFPMGPAFLLGEFLGVPMWIWERLWSAAVMLLAYEGARRLAGCWPGIAPLGAVLAGLAYMLSPRVLTTVGGLSGETLPGSVLPWTLIPLVLYLRGRLQRLSAFVLSAATIPWMGGQNATLVLACLLLPAMLLGLAEGRTWRRRLADLTVWGGMVLVATVWWVVPLLVLGAYAPPFLDFIESARNTAGSTGWLSSLRGTSHWVAFFPGGGRVGWEGGYQLASSPALLLTTTFVAAGGLVGLLQRRLWQRRVLLLSVLAGLAVLSAGRGGLAGSVLSDMWLQALDTFLVPLRNIHKFDPVVRLPLSLGLAALISSAPNWWKPERTNRLLPVRSLLSVAMVVAVMAAALPAVSGALRTEGGMTDIPASWRETADYLSSQPGPVRVLVLPGAGFATQTWGRTVDEPIQVLQSPPWLARAQVTVAPGSTLRMLDSVERTVGEARPQAALSAAVRRLGITHVVVRHDLDADETDAPPPDLVEASVAGIAGARRVAGFGSIMGGRRTVEVYAIESEGDPRVSLLSWDGHKSVSGGPEVVGDLVAAGLVGNDQAVVLAESDEPVDVVTDSNRRVERSFGRVQSAVSAVMTRREAFRINRQQHDYTDEHVPDALTTAEYQGAKQILASSSGGYADVLGPVRPEEHPYAAFDGSFFTSWASAPLSRAEGQWLEVRFGRLLTPGPVSLKFDTIGGAGVKAVRLKTDGGTVTARVRADGSVQGIELPDEPTTALRVTVAEAIRDKEQVRLSDLRIDGHVITRSLSLPGTVANASSVYISSERPRRACVTTVRGVSCDPRRYVETPETPGFDRTVMVSQAGKWELSGRALATHGQGVEQLFAPLNRDLVALGGSSTFAGDPAVVAANAFDGRAETGWYASPLDPSPTLQLTWRKKRTVANVGAVLGSGQPGRLPEALVVDPQTGRDEPQLVATTGPTAGQMRPVRTNRLQITASGETRGRDGVGISELVIDSLADLRYRPDVGAETGTACGFGPSVAIDEHVVKTRLVGMLSDVRAGRDLRLVPCSAEDIDIRPGRHRIRVTNPAGFAVSELWLTPSASTVPPSDQTSASHVRSWTSTERTVDVETDRDSVLALSESVNPGWVARIGDVSLRPVVIDGWRQGWHVPAGTGGVVKLLYAPQTGFRIAVLAGLLLAALLSAVALGILVTTRRLPDRPDRGPSRRKAARARPTLSESVRMQQRAAVATGGVLLALVSVPLALGALTGRLTRTAPTLVVTGACTAALLAAALFALVERQSVVIPPVGSDVMTALVVGVVGGRVLSRRA